MRGGSRPSQLSKASESREEAGGDADHGEVDVESSPAPPPQNLPEGVPGETKSLQLASDSSSEAKDASLQLPECVPLPSERETLPTTASVTLTAPAEPRVMPPVERPSEWPPPFQHQPEGMPEPSPPAERPREWPPPVKHRAESTASAERLPALTPPTRPPLKPRPPVEEPLRPERTPWKQSDPPPSVEWPPELPAPLAAGPVIGQSLSSAAVPSKPSLLSTSPLLQRPPPVSRPPPEPPDILLPLQPSSAERPERKPPYLALLFVPPAELWHRQL